METLMIGIIVSVTKHTFHLAFVKFQIEDIVRFISGEIKLLG